MITHHFNQANDETLWDVAECAYFAHMTCQGIRKAIKERRLRARKFGNSWVIKDIDLNRFMDKTS